MGMLSSDQDMTEIHTLNQLAKSVDCGISHNYLFLSRESINLHEDVARKIFNWLMSLKPAQRLDKTAKMVLNVQSFNQVLEENGINTSNT